MDNENQTEVVTDTNNNEGGSEDANFVKVPKEEYDKTISTLGSLKRELKDLKKPVEKSKESETTNSNSNDLGEKAYLAVNGIKSADEVAFFKKMKQETGKDAEALLDSTYFQSEFKSFKELKVSSDAMPGSSKRSNNSQVDSVDYWLAKGELPPVSEVQLRRDVVNARMKKETSKGVFYNQ
jgi:hypothetical protein